jgi:hypothetical protein
MRASLIHIKLDFAGDGAQPEARALANEARPVHPSAPPSRYSPATSLRFTGAKMFPESNTPACAEAAYCKQLCADAHELRQAAQQLRIASQNLRLLCKASVSRAQQSRASSARLVVREPQALNCVT